MAELEGPGEGELKAPRDGRPWLAGTFTALTLLEVVQLVFTSLKSGVLWLSFAGPGGEAASQRPHRRSLYFREGQLVFAASSEPSDRLGPVLWRVGLLDWATLVRCSAEVKPGRPLGQVLIDAGVLTSADLYGGLAAQVREILFDAILDSEGEFLFVEGPHGELNEVRLPERFRELLMEGLKRVEATEQWLAVVGGRGARLARTEALPIDPSEYTLRLLEALDGTRTFAEAADESRLGLYFALHEAVPLLEAGVLVGSDQAEPMAPAGPEEAPAPAPSKPSKPARPPRPARPSEPSIIEALMGATMTPVPQPGGPFELYRRIFRRVHGALAAARPGAERRLDSYFEKLPEKRRFVFEGVGFGPDGDVDVSRVLDNVTSSGAYQGAGARARSLEGLEELLTFALFEVKNLLPKAEAEQLLREVGRMQVGKA